MKHKLINPTKSLSRHFTKTLALSCHFTEAKKLLFDTNDALSARTYKQVCVIIVLFDLKFYFCDTSTCGIHTIIR